MEINITYEAINPYLYRIGYFLQKYVYTYKVKITNASLSLQSDTCRLWRLSV